MNTAGKIMSFRQDGNEICVKYEQTKTGGESHKG